MKTTIRALVLALLVAPGVGPTAGAQQPGPDRPAHQSGPDATAQQPAPDAAARQSGPPTFEASSALVVLPVTVTDRQGRLVADLPRESFIVYDNNHPSPIKFFSSEDAPVTVALVVDNSASMRKRHGEVVAAGSMFARLSNPADELMALLFNDNVEDALGGRMLSASDEKALAGALEAARPDGRTALYDALMTGLDRLDEIDATRKVMIVISDGGDNASRTSLDAVLDRARRSTVTIYTIGLIDPELVEVRGEQQVDTGVLQKLAELSGGKRYLPASAGPLLQACGQIAHEIRQSYTLGIEPGSSDGSFHHLRVTVASPQGEKLVVRTRVGYVAPGVKGSK